MKLDVTKSYEVGAADHGWLKAKHYFSFANYYNPDRMGFGPLRVINDDKIAAGSGFGTHPHKDMEIITIPLKGTVSHKDSEGNEGSIRKGEVQVMSAGTGVLHSEFNHSKDEELGLFQIWIEPNQKGVKPRYGQKQFHYQKTPNVWTQLVSPIEKETELGLKIHQEAYINASRLEKESSLKYQLNNEENGLYILVVSGQIEIDGQSLGARDSASILDTSEIEIKATEESELIAIEVPF